MDVIASHSMEAASLPGLSILWAHWLTAQDLNQLVHHPLLRSLERNELSLAALKTLLIQHGHYSRHFTRYLCALMGQLERAEDVLALMENMREEMGVDGQGRVTHAELFQRTLHVLGISNADEKPLPETTTMVKTMLAHCQNSDALAGLAAMCLGAEAIVPLIYRPIMQALVQKGYGDEATEFFSLHIEEDEGHAFTMLAILQRLVNGDEKRRESATRIGHEMIECRIAMFDAIWQQSLALAASESGSRDRESRFSSSDFWRVPSRLQARLPDRLCHPQVMQATHGHDATFSSQRKHKVHIVDLPSHAISMTVGRLDPAETTRLHRHNYETMIYIMQGDGYSRIGDQKVPWSAGDAIYVPVWAEHQHVNTCEGECVYLACENAPMLQNMGGIALREELDV
ncbi:iron-containing redox enzyme family protein [Pseudomonas sp. RGM 3321]|uniref:iron-containing redox enzyme family protein n=1 Tax=Pseudomonas sp. RGM 3321 TaxID=2930089 RepID=UPI001FCBE2BD|nr:iron-containing redox enzyme family protein [Pseudomonas sp. RGM 3321]